MAWLDETLELLAKTPVCGYRAGGAPASEPTALAALALAGHGLAKAAQQAAEWLAELQAANGSVGVCEGQPTPAWTTSLAMLAWLSVAPGEDKSSVDRAAAWALSFKGTPIPRTAQSIADLGHDTTLIGWPWCEGTHSWLEPTAFFVLALKSIGRAEHARTREAVRLLLDRQLATGGCNYGNTVVLGQPLRPHVQPTGIVLLALAGERDGAAKTAKSLVYLRGAISAETTTTSLAWALLGLAAHRQTPIEAEEWLAAAARRTLDRDKAPHKLALLALAALAERSPLVSLPEGAATP